MAAAAAPAGLRGGGDAGRRRRAAGLQAGRGDRQAVRDRVRRHRDPDRHPGVRRLRVHGGVPDRPLLPRRQGAGDRRGHLGGAAAADRPAPRPAGGIVSTDEHEIGGGPGADAGARPSGRRPSWPRQNKLYVRDRIDLLFDEGSFVEDGQLANALADGLPADGVVTGRGLVQGRPALVVANDPSVKAGSWGARTVEKIIRMTEVALRDELPIFWFIDSAGARITDQVDLFPGRRGAGRIFPNQVALSGKVPQICCLFGPSAAGGAYIPSFCDIVIMVEGNASMYLGSPRMAEMVVGERVTPGGDGRRPDARRGLRLRRPARRRRRRGDRAGQAVLLLPAAELAAVAADLRRRRPRRGSSPPTWCRPRSAPATTSTP